MKDDGATLGAFEESVAQVRVARSPDSGDSHFSRVYFRSARGKPAIADPAASELVLLERLVIRSERTGV